MVMALICRLVCLGWYGRGMVMQFLSVCDGHGIRLVGMFSNWIKVIVKRD